MRLLLLGLLLAATSAAADAPPPPPPQPQLPPPSQPMPALSVWAPVTDGGFLHLQSGLICPALIGRFHRSRVSLFDGFGWDVGCNYMDGPSDITLYLTRRPTSDVEAAMAQAKRELFQVQASQHLQLLSETKASNGQFDWHVALYAEDGARHTAIWIADMDGWTAEYRATYPDADDGVIANDLKAFDRQFAKSAGTHLDLCAKSPPPTRDGAAITDPEVLKKTAMMGSLLGGAAQAAANGGKATPAGAAVAAWCAETSFLKDRKPVVFWRGVRADGSDAMMDRITLGTVGPPPVLGLSSDGLVGLVENGGKKDGKPPLWSATMQRNDQTLIYGYFQGRPSPEAAADLMIGIADKTTPLLGGYSVKGKQLNLIMPGP